MHKRIAIESKASETNRLVGLEDSRNDVTTEFRLTTLLFPFIAAVSYYCS